MEQERRMGRPPKGDEALTESLRVRITGKTEERLDAVAIALSKPRAIQTPSDVARTALDLGLAIIEKRLVRGAR